MEGRGTVEVWMIGRGKIERGERWHLVSVGYWRCWELEALVIR